MAARYFQGMSEAWITSGTPWPPTDRIARSTSFRPKRVRRDLLQREAVRGELLQRQLAGLVAVAARALDA